MLITISGKTGTGKSATAESLSKRTGIPVLDTSAMFRAMAKRHGMDLIQFGKYVQEHPKIDRALDDKFLARAKRYKNVILIGRLAGHLTAKRGIPAVRVLITSSPETAARRVALREGVTYKKALADNARRDYDLRERHLETSGLDLNDPSVYSFVVRTDALTVEEVVTSLVKKLPHLWPTSKKSPKKTSRPTPQPRQKPRLRKSKP